MLMRQSALLLVALATAPAVAVADELTYKSELVTVLVRQVGDLLKGFDADSGHFGSGIWICTDQNAMYPLAVAYTLEAEENPYYRDAGLLEVIMKAGDALIADADTTGQWVFRKKDGSTWGNIWMPWTYSRWVRAYQMIKDEMPADRREAWTEALALGFTGISATQLRHVHNIPAHHAMGLYVAGRALDRSDWCDQAAALLVKVAEVQAEGGYWSENIGPVVGYNFVYLDALGTYYALSGDRRVLPALEKGATFHYHFRYPNGQRVETIDERNPLKPGIDTGNVGFTFTPAGRRYLHEQWSRYGRDKLPADLCASLLLYGQEGPMADAPSDARHVFVLTEGGIARAATIRQGPWFGCLSAYTAPIPGSRWIQDRQNMVSLYHDDVGVILGGGNTKLQPGWSTFTVGDPTLLRHTPGDESPDFVPKGELFHVPSEARVIREPDAGLDLAYGPVTCRVRVRPKDDRKLEYVVEKSGASSLPVVANLVLIPQMGKPITSAGGGEAKIGQEVIQWPAEKVGGMVSHAGCQWHVPPTATLHWPALPHNPYRKDGRATTEEGLIVISIPLDAGNERHVITIEVPR